jgi:Ran GTPase-activating protein (RanGAP) involved in mRNA processing and transport
MPFRFQELVSVLSICPSASLCSIDLSRNGLPDEQVSKIIDALSGLENLLKVNLSSNKMGIAGSKSLSTLLADPACKLEELYLGNNNLRNDSIKLIADALAQNESVKVLSLGDDWVGPPRFGQRIEPNRITAPGWEIFSSAPHDMSGTLLSLNLNNMGIDDNSATILANAFYSSTVLKHLNLSGSLARSDGWYSILNWLQNLKSDLESLDIGRNLLDNDIAIALSNVLVNVTSLKALDISYNPLVARDGWQAFFESFPCPGSSLETLRLSSNRIRNNGIAVLMDKISDSSAIQELHLDFNKFSNLEPFVALLQYPMSALKVLKLTGTLTDDIAVMFANALAFNKNLKELTFSDRPTRLTIGSKAISNLLCNRSSIVATLYSNHTLEKLSGTRRTDNIRDSLRMNRRNSKEEAAREKILKYHILNGSGDTDQFSLMAREVLPHAMSWIGRDDAGFWLMYHVTRDASSKVFV